MYANTKQLNQKTLFWMLEIEAGAMDRLGWVCSLFPDSSPATCGMMGQFKLGNKVLWQGRWLYRERQLKEKLENFCPKSALPKS